MYMYVWNNSWFCLSLGGLSYAAGYSAQWDRFFTEIEPIASAVPYMTCIGVYEADYTGSTYV